MPHKEPGGTARFSISLPSEVALELDGMIAEKGYAIRSLAIADMVRASLVEHKSHFSGEVAGTITLLYDHHKRGLQGLLTDLQHDHTDLIISTVHVHLDHDNCLEVLVVRGPAPQIKVLADTLIGAKGVKQGHLTINAITERAPEIRTSGKSHSHYE